MWEEWEERILKLGEISGENDKPLAHGQVFLVKVWMERARVRFAACFVPPDCVWGVRLHGAPRADYHISLIAARNRITVVHEDTGLGGMKGLQRGNDRRKGTEE